MRHWLTKMHFTNLTNVQDSFCIAGRCRPLRNWLHSSPKTTQASANPLPPPTEGFLTRSKRFSHELLCSSYWFLTDSPRFHHRIPLQEQLIIILSWASKPGMMGEIAYAAFAFFIHASMLLMPQFTPSVTALLQKYWQWCTIICLCPSVPASPVGNGKEWKRAEKIYQVLCKLKQTCHLRAPRGSYSHTFSVQMKETIWFQTQKPDPL